MDRFKSWFGKWGGLAIAGALIIGCCVYKINIYGVPLINPNFIDKLVFLAPDYIIMIAVPYIAFTLALMTVRKDD